MIMNKNFTSRGPDLDIEKAIAESGGNRFHMVIEASARARQIRRQNASSNRFDHTHPVVTALIEFQEGKHKK
jgi:DNA-directed RNA polymerase subunit K/omega